MTNVTNYKGVDINVDNNGNFNCRIEKTEEYLRGETLEEVKTKIDNVMKKIVNREPGIAEVNVGDYYHSERKYLNVEITSIRESGEAFISGKHEGKIVKDRKNLRYVYKPTEANKKIITRLNEITMQRKQLEEEEGELEGKLEFYKLEDFYGGDKDNGND